MKENPMFDLRGITMGFKWWERVLLWFKPAHYTIEEHITLKGKWLFGKLYIVDYKRR